MNDKQRYQFAGEPTRCINCGAPLNIRRYPHLDLVSIICPNYGKTYTNPMMAVGGFSGSGDVHEHYRFLNSDPDLPAIFRPHRVGNMAPTARSIFYTTVIFIILFGTALVLSLLGG